MHELWNYLTYSLKKEEWKNINFQSRRLLKRLKDPGRAFLKICKYGKYEMRWESLDSVATNFSECLLHEYEYYALVLYDARFLLFKLLIL